MERKISFFLVIKIYCKHIKDGGSIVRIIKMFFNERFITQLIYMFVVLCSRYKWDILYDVYFLVLHPILNILCAEAIAF